MATTSPDKARIFSLDAIRGVAVMGIFSVNVIAFAMIEAAYFNPAAYGGWHGASLGVWAANMLVIDGKLRTLFSMLFGASTLLVIERAEAGGLSVRDVLRVLHRVKGPLVGADVVELLPAADQGGRTAVAAAKLVKELAGLMVGGGGAPWPRPRSS